MELVKHSWLCCFPTGWPWSHGCLSQRLCEEFTLYSLLFLSGPVACQCTNTSYFCSDISQFSVHCLNHYQTNATIGMIECFIALLISIVLCRQLFFWLLSFAGLRNYHCISYFLLFWFLNRANFPFWVFCFWYWGCFHSCHILMMGWCSGFALSGVFEGHLWLLQMGALCLSLMQKGSLST